METIGERLVAMRKEVGMTQVQLAERLGIDRGTLRGYETDTSDISVKMLNRAILACRLDPLSVIARFMVNHSARQRGAAKVKTKTNL